MAGGAGGVIEGKITVTAGSTLTVIVGRAGGKPEGAMSEIELTQEQKENLRKVGAVAFDIEAKWPYVPSAYREKNDKDESLDLSNSFSLVYIAGNSNIVIDIPAAGDNDSDGETVEDDDSTEGSDVDNIMFDITGDWTTTPSNHWVNQGNSGDCIAERNRSYATTISQTGDSVVINGNGQRYSGNMSGATCSVSMEVKAPLEQGTSGAEK